MNELTADGLRLSGPDDGVVRAVIDRGTDNLLTTALCEALTGYLRRPQADAHVLVVAPAGESFCLGRQRGAASVAELREEVGALVALNRALRATRLVTVAQVNGDAAGFGVGLAALCDLTVSVASARFWFPEVDMDLAPALVLAWLPRLVGHKQALRLTATGRRLTAAEAAGIGLVTTVVATEEALVTAVRDEVADLTKHDRRVHGEIKAFLRASAALSEDQAYDLAADRLVLESIAQHGVS